MLNNRLKPIPARRHTSIPSEDIRDDTVNPPECVMIKTIAILHHPIFSILALSTPTNKVSKVMQTNQAIKHCIDLIRNQKMSQPASIPAANPLNPKGLKP